MRVPKRSVELIPFTFQTSSDLLPLCEALARHLEAKNVLEFNQVTWIQQESEYAAEEAEQEASFLLCSFGHTSGEAGLVEGSVALSVSYQPHLNVEQLFQKVVRQHADALDMSENALASHIQPVEIPNTQTFWEPTTKQLFVVGDGMRLIIRDSITSDPLTASQGVANIVLDYDANVRRDISPESGKRRPGGAEFVMPSLYRSLTRIPWQDSRFGVSFGAFVIRSDTESPFRWEDFRLQLRYPHETPDSQEATLVMTVSDDAMNRNEATHYLDQLDGVESSTSVRGLGHSAFWVRRVRWEEETDELLVFTDQIRLQMTSPGDALAQKTAKRSAKEMLKSLPSRMN